MRLRPREPRRAVALSLMATPIIYGFALLFEHLILPRLPTGPSVAVHLVILIGLIALPFLAFAIPCATVVRLVLLALSRRAAGRLSITLAASLVLAGFLFVVGGQLRGLYGFDPPYSLFLLGSALQLIGPLAAFAALIESQASRLVA